MPVHLPAAVGSVLSLLAAAAAQQIDLPGGTGHLAPTAEWTVLRAAELALAERPSDPKAETARAMLRGVVDELRQRNRTGEHVLLHGSGPAGELRLVNCYRTAVSTTAAELRSEKGVDDLRKSIEPNLAISGSKVTFAGPVDPKLWAPGSVRLRFDMRKEALQFRDDCHAVPAGDSLQFFEVMYFPDDAGAEAAIEALLRTFDGARDSARGNLLRGALTGAIGGSVAGVVFWWVRRRRERTAAPAAATRRSP